MKVVANKHCGWCGSREERRGSDVNGFRLNQVSIWSANCDSSNVDNKTLAQSRKIDLQKSIL